MDDKKKKYIIPEAEVISFEKEDIITLSGGTQQAMMGGLFGDDDNTEEWL